MRLHGLMLLAALLTFPASAAADESENHRSAAGDGDSQVVKIAEFESQIQPFLSRYCLDCHSGEDPKGDRQFDSLDGRISNDNGLVDYQDIVDLLNLGEMPPADADQPPDRQRRRAIELLTKATNEFHRLRNHRGQVVLRRLNAREYRHTIRDLLHLDVSIFDPTESFPRDRTSAHLDNVGDTLVTSGYLLAKYLDAAETVVSKALNPIEKPRVRTWTFRDGFDQQPEIDQVHRKTNRFRHMTLYDVVGADKPEGAYGPIHAFAEGVPIDGIYELRIKAEAVNRINPYDPEFLGTDPSEPLRLGIVPGDQTVGNLHLPQPNEPLLAEIELEDRPRWYTVRLWLDRGITPRFTFQNGLMDVRNLWSRLIKKYRDQFPEDIPKGIVAARFNAIKHGKLPQIHIHEIEIEGPHYESWPTASQQTLLGEDWSRAVSGKLSIAELRNHLERFLRRAYRRPVASDEVDRLMALVDARAKAGRNVLQAYGDGLKAVLCSPNFLYLDSSTVSQSQPADQPVRKLNDYALASRLSYFLWSSMPDEVLFDLAEQGKLSDDEVLAVQVDRMLADPRSDAFINGFLDSWLTLRDLGSTPPDRGDFREFYHYHLGDAMRRETTLFTRHLIDQNLDLGNYLDSDFTFVNRALARMYGMPHEIEPGEFQRVDIDDPRRGGLLGQASVLTVTANGIDTSPVTRGVWLLENVLGTPPSPPPPDVEPLDPDTRGATTIRDQLQKHRQVSSCNDCHRKIDPIGFALENFDPIGRWRQRYDGKSEIDASGQLPSGDSFQDVVGFKQILSKKKPLFSRALAEKMLAYASGRQLEASDRPAVDKILEELESEGFGMRDLIHAVVQSEPFRSK